MDRFAMLPLDCVSKILSVTSPVDAARSSVMSKGFKSAAGSDIVWETFLPSDLHHIILRSGSSLVYATKKELYFNLCDSPLMLDGGKLLGQNSYGLKKVNSVVRFVDHEPDGDAERRAITLQLTPPKDEPARDLRINRNIPCRRRDGWLEVEMGTFNIDQGDDGEVEARLLEITRLHGKSGLIVEGIEFRPL